MWLVWVLGWAAILIHAALVLGWLVPPPLQIRCLALRPSERSWPEFALALAAYLWCSAAEQPVEFWLEEPEISYDEVYIHDLGYLDRPE